MLTGFFRIKNQLGLHARPAAKLAKLAGQFCSEIKLIKANKEADVKSVLDLLSLACRFDEEVKLIVDGQDEEKAFISITLLIEAEIGERIYGAEV
jgi:phosphocarrier protein